MYFSFFFHTVIRILFRILLTRPGRSRWGHSLGGTKRTSIRPSDYHDLHDLVFLAASILAASTSSSSLAKASMKKIIKIGEHARPTLRKDQRWSVTVPVSNPMSSSESLLRPSTSRHDTASNITNAHGDMLR